MNAGQISPALPFAKKKAVEILKASYSSREEAAQQDSRGVRELSTSRAIRRSGRSAGRGDRLPPAQVLAIYDRNVFPEMKVTWGTYPQQHRPHRFPRLLPLP